MRAIALLPLVVVLGACSAPSSSDLGPTPTPSGTSTPTPTPTPNPGDHLSADTTWSTPQTLANPLTIDAGVTLTVTSNASVAVAPGAKIYIQGTLIVNGNAGAPVTFDSSSPGTPWSGFDVQAGGVATVRNIGILHASTGVRTEAGAGLSRWIGISMDSIQTPFAINADTKVCRAHVFNQSGSSNFGAGTATFVDSEFLNGGGDTLVFAGTSTLVVDHSHVSGVTAGWHCITHGGGAGTTITVTKSILEISHYAFMLNGITAGHGTLNNNQISIPNNPTGDFNPASLTAGNVINAQSNYWGHCPATVNDATGDVPTGYDVSSCIASATNAAVVDAGLRAQGAGCESDVSF